VDPTPPGWGGWGVESWLAAQRADGMHLPEWLNNFLSPWVDVHTMNILKLKDST